MSTPEPTRKRFQFGLTGLLVLVLVLVLFTSAVLGWVITIYTTNRERHAQTSRIHTFYEIKNAEDWVCFQWNKSNRGVFKFNQDETGWPPRSVRCWLDRLQPDHLEHLLEPNAVVVVLEFTDQPEDHTIVVREVSGSMGEDFLAALEKEPILQRFKFERKDKER